MTTRPHDPARDPAPEAHHDDAAKAGDLGFALPPPARISRGRAALVAGAVALIAGAAFLVRWIPMRGERRALEAATKQSVVAPPKVQVIAPSVVAADRAITLPGSVMPLEETVIYPRVNGYVRAWHKDLGDRVRDGDLLAEIDTPELDQQLAQARAQLAQAEAALVQARANAAFSKQSLARYEQLVPSGLATRQDLDKARAQAAVDEAAITVASASIGAQRANVEGLGRIKAFARVTAPFAGAVVARSVERGALVTAGTGTPLFKVAATDPVRVFVQVPQGVAPSVRLGTSAIVSVRELPGRTIEGKVAHAAGALDAATRTMSVEVRVNNPKGEILAGMFAQVALTLPMPRRLLAVPSTALLNDGSGLRVAIVTPASTIHMVPVVVERDTGPTIEIAGGLDGTERVVKVPTVDLAEGREVEVVP